jgi:hypothetical protein
VVEREQTFEESPSTGDAAEFWRSGTSAKGEFHCSECSYGVIVTRELPTCPMCGGESWERATWSPFARSRALV